jgi:hypothetical protein
MATKVTESPVTPGVAKGSRIPVLIGKYTLAADKKVKGQTVRKAGTYNLIIEVDPGVADILELPQAGPEDLTRTEGTKEISYATVKHGRTAFVDHPVAGTKTKGGSGKGKAKLQLMLPKGLTRKQIAQAFAGKTKIKVLNVKGGRKIPVV